MNKEKQAEKIIGVFADIHSNIEALKASVDYMESRGVEEYIFLGDCTGDLPCPEKTLKFIRDFSKRKKVYLIKGNKEEYIEDGIGDAHPEWDEYKSIIGMFRYVYPRITQEERDFWGSLPITEVINFDGFPSLRICHGWVDSSRTKILPGEEKNAELFPKVNEDFILVAHTHKQFDTTEFGKRVMNPGSVGVVNDGSQKAHCMILHGNKEGWEPEFLQLSYDIDKEIASMEEENLFEIAPQWARLTVKMLEGYPIYHSRALNHAMEICRRETGECEWPKIAEEYMERGVTEYLEGLKKP